MIPDDWPNHSQLRSARIQVEISIEWLKTYDLCSEQLREKIGGAEWRILAIHHRSYFIAGGFTNYNIIWNKAYMSVLL